MKVTKGTVISSTRVPSLSNLKTHYDTPIPVIIMFTTIRNCHIYTLMAVRI